MANNIVEPSYKTFTDIDGNPLEDGYLYIGEVNLNPEVSPVTVYWDEAKTIPAAQPIRTIGGYPSRSGSAGAMFIDGDYSLTVRNKNGTLIYSTPSSNGIMAQGVTFNVDSIAELITTDISYGTVNVLGYSTPNNGGGGIFNYNSTTDKSTADGEIIIDPSVSLDLQGTGVGSGCWIRQDNGNLIKSLNSNVSSKNKFEERLKKASLLEQTVVWVGDSITEQGKPTADGEGYTTHLEDIFVGATYINEGIGGNTTLDIISRISTITAHSADLYVLAIGVNDVRYNDTRGATSATEFITNIQSIYNSIIAAGGELAIIGVWPSFWVDQFSALYRAETDNRIKQYNNELREFCFTNNVLFSNPEPIIRECVNLDNSTTIVPDGIHPYFGGKKLYADAVISNDLHGASYYQNTYINGKIFFKFVFGNNGQTDGYVGIKNIQINGTTIQEAFGQSANLSFNDITGMYGSYSAIYAGFFNKPNDFPLITTVALDAWPDSVIVSGVTKTTGDFNRGPKTFETWFSTDADAMVDPNHKSWVLHDKENRVDANVVNLVPKQRNGFYYRIRVNTIGAAQPSVLIKRIGTRYPVRVQTLSLVSGTEIRYDLIFGDGAVLEADALEFSLTSILMWESELEENDLILSSFNGSLGDFVISHSTDPEALSDPVHPSWRDIITSTGDGTYSLPRVKPIAYLGDSGATDVPGIVAAYNALLQRLRDVNLMDLP